MRYWQKLSKQQQEKRITDALAANVDYKQKLSLGIPASKLDPVVFSEEASFLRDAPLLRCYVQNPNHIGCHTTGESEPFFHGTQEIERDLVELLSVDLFKAEEHSCDGYVAAGGTEANIQAVWIYRNYFIREHGAKHDQITILCSEDTHYSVVKAADLLNISVAHVAVNADDRRPDVADLEKTLDRAVAAGSRFFIVFANMGTTMFGSIDDPDVYVRALRTRDLSFKLHLDGAFGGFIYPTSDPESKVNFSHPDVSSITLDAHKMLQAPYGTGIFLARKGLMQYVFTEEASYVHGMDITLSGSRSGTNAVAIWMILVTYGPYGWQEKINKLLFRTDWCCRELDALGIKYYRHPRMNIITLRADRIDPGIARKFGLVPDSHGSHAQWYKIVVMDHVEIQHLRELLEDLKGHGSV